MILHASANPSLLVFIFMPGWHCCGMALYYQVKARSAAGLHARCLLASTFQQQLSESVFGV